MVGELVEKQRPELLTDAFISDLCDWMAEGNSVRSYCRKYPEYKPSTICTWLLDFKDFAEQYTRAINMRADAKFDMVDDVVQDMRSGRVDAQMARVEIDAIKWQAGKMAPKKYGDKLDVDHTSQGEKITWGLNMGGRIPLEVTQQLNLETKQQPDN